MFSSCGAVRCDTNSHVQRRALRLAFTDKLRGRTVSDCGIMASRDPGLWFTFQALFLTTLDFANFFGDRESFGHRAVKFADSLPNFPANGLMSLVGGLLGPDIFA